MFPFRLAAWSRDSRGKRKGKAASDKGRERGSLGRHEWVSDVGHGTACISKEERRRGKGPLALLERSSLEGQLDARASERASERRGTAAGELYNMNAPGRGAVSAGYNQFWLQSGIAARSTVPIAEKKVRASNYRSRGPRGASHPAVASEMGKVVRERERERERYWREGWKSMETKRVILERREKKTGKGVRKG